MTATNPLGVHFIPKHTGRHHYEYINALRPGIAKVVGDSTPDVQQMADMYQAAPDAIHYWRNHALSEQHDALWRDPVGTAHRHVNELHRDIQERYAQAAARGLTLPDREQVRLLGINEPVIELFKREEDGSNYGDWLRMMRERTPLLDAYMFNFGEAANALGYGTGLGNFSSGQPANLKPGDYPTFDWFPRTAKFLEHTRGRNALGQHEYWTAAKGPEGWWDWHTCRFFHYDVDCDIDVLECGVEEAIDNKPHQGWIGLLTPAQYAAQMGTYIRRARTDPRFRGATPFSLDGDKYWVTFFIEPAMAEFLQLARELEAVKPAEGKPVTVQPPQPEKPRPNIFLPSVRNGPVAGTDADENWRRSREFVRKWEGGWANHPADKGGPTNKGVTFGEFKRWRALQGMGEPTIDDLRNLADDEADAFYHRLYWVASGAVSQPWPQCLVTFDTAVLHGVGAAEWFSEEVGGSALGILGLRLLTYAASIDREPSQEAFWQGWRNRTMQLRKTVREAAGQPV